MSSFRIRGLNAALGINIIDHSIKTTFFNLKMKKVHRYIIFKIDEKRNQVIVEKTGVPNENYDNFSESLPENDCRYAIYDYDFVTLDNCRKSKIFFITWTPEGSRIRAKMLYAASKDGFKRELDGVHYDIQATDPTEMDLEVIRRRAQ